MLTMSVRTWWDNRLGAWRELGPVLRLIVICVVIGTILAVVAVAQQERSGVYLVGTFAVLASGTTLLIRRKRRTNPKQ
jgi:hypothetical protein